MHTKTLALCAVVLAAGPPLASAQSVTDPTAFVALAASSNMFEIESSELALDTSTNEDVKAFARHMVDDHTAAGEKMKAAAETDGILPPATMTDKEQAALEPLQAADGGAFDKAYLAAQVSAHDEAVALFRSFSENGQDSAVKRFAAETLPTLEEHQGAVHALAEQD